MMLIYEGRDNSKRYNELKYSYPPWIDEAHIQENYNTPRYRTPQAIPRSPIMKEIPL